MKGVYFDMARNVSRAMLSPRRSSFKPCVEGLEDRQLLSGNAVLTFAGNAQHTAVYQPAAQDVNTIHWQTLVDLNRQYSGTDLLIHYGAPLVTASNTVIVPVKTGATDGFQVEAFDGATGTAKYTLATDYTLPSHNWTPSYSPALAQTTSGTRLYYAGAGGTIYYIDNPDSNTPDTPVHEVFYTTLANYQANASAFNSSIFIDTPITADSNGAIFFGFRVQGMAPAPLSTTQSGYARIDANGNAIYVLAGTAAGDSNIARDSHNSAPALSNDSSTVYVAVKAGSTDYYGYLLGLDSTTLATKYKVFLKDPRNGNAAGILDDGTASPMVAPDGDVYFGVFGNPYNGSRGWLLRFSGDLSVEKTPGGFGWDYTPAIVPASMDPAYTGSSSYLIFSKFNNYADPSAPSGDDFSDGINKIALLDPNATEVDPHATSNGLLVMREVLTVPGPVADPPNVGSSSPDATREWCINTAAVDPATDSIFTPSEDGHVYQWCLGMNSLESALTLGTGIGEAYVPTVIGPDGTIYTINNGTLFAIGSLSGVSVEVMSSVPDVRSAVVGQPLTFTAMVMNPTPGGSTPTGTVTFEDTTGTTPIVLASNVPLNASGQASVKTSSLAAGGRFITAIYSGDSNFSGGSSTLVQFMHKYATTTTLISSANPANFGQAVTFTATVTPTISASQVPTGMVTFLDGTKVLAQLALNSSGTASFTTSTLGAGSHTITAIYYSDPVFATSSGDDSANPQIVQDGTNTALSSAPSPSVYGQAVTLTAIITPQDAGAGTPTGTVTFMDGTTTLATGVPVNSGTATFTTSALSVASHSLTATFTGTPGWGSSSGNTTQVVNQDSTTTSLVSSANPSVYGQHVQFTATVTAKAPGSGTPTGTVIFMNGSVRMGSGTLNSSGKAFLNISILPPGAHSISAVYAGDTNFTTSTSATLTQTVNADGTVTKVVSSLNPSTFGTAVTFTATVTAKAPGSGIPAGYVTFMSGPNVLGKVPLDTTGHATYTTTTLAVGSHAITAVYSGSLRYLKSTSAVLTQTVNAAPTLTSFVVRPLGGGSLAVLAASPDTQSGTVLPPGETSLDAAIVERFFSQPTALSGHGFLEPCTKPATSLLNDTGSDKLF
jgi:hypothetical protein